MGISAAFGRARTPWVACLRESEMDIAFSPEHAY